MTCDCALVERVGREAVITCCKELGCNDTTIRSCIPYSDGRHIDLCSECHAKVIALQAVSA